MKNCGENQRGCTSKITHVSVVKCHNSDKPGFKLMLSHSMLTKMIQFITRQIQFLMNIDENMRNKRKIQEN